MNQQTHPATLLEPRIPCTDPRFIPVPSACTDVSRTFERARAELASGEAAHWPQRRLLSIDTPTE